MQTEITILGRTFTIDCAEGDCRRLEDLARALEARLQRFPDGADDAHRLVLTSLALLDETQATSAALVRARDEIERLSDMLVEAQLETAKANGAIIDDRGRVDALRVAQGAA